MFGIYSHIRNDNVNLKRDMFPKSHITTGEKSILLSIFYLKKGNFKMDILEPIVIGGKNTVANYKATKFTVDLDAMGPTYKMEWHRKTGEVIFIDVLKSIMNVNKL